MAIRHLNKFLSSAFTGLMAVVASSAAFAADAGGAAGGATGGGGTFGGVLSNLTSSIGGSTGILSAAAYLSGLYFAAEGLFKFKDHVDGTNHTPLSAGVKRFIAGGMLFSLPFMASALKGTLVAQNIGSVLFNNQIQSMSTGASDGADQKIIGFITDLVGPAGGLLNVFAYVAAILFLITGVLRLTKTAQDGPRGPAGLGTIMTFIVAGALFSFSNMIGAFSSSLFSDPNVSNIVQFDQSMGGGEDLDKTKPMVQALLLFVTLVGVVAFLRGWFVLKAFADGNQQASVSQALTFLIGGTIAINIGEFVQTISNTLGLTGIIYTGG